MRNINKLKYTSIVAAIGMAAVVFGSGANAITETDETEVETSTELITIDLTPAEERTTEIDTEPQDETEDSLALAAGAGELLEYNEDEYSENVSESESDNEIETLAVDEEAELQVLEAEEAAEPTTYWGYTNLGIANVDNHLNIRQEPSESGKVVGKLPKDAACEILEIDENGWAHIKSGKVEGYCSSDYLYMGEEAIARGKEVASMIAVVNTETLKVREEPNTECAVITLIPLEEELEVVDIMENGWIKFLLDDEEAYVSGEFVDVEERLEKAVSVKELTSESEQGVSNVKIELVQYAKQFVGNPYVWGGTSLTNGADCSGFTLSVFKKFGVTLPHHAASQAQMGTKVNMSDLQPGDLIFYAKNGSINHVAIYIGNGQVVHASNPKSGIKISAYNYRTPYCARRFL
jgi:uncharacterized protein YgiM (DUF1202 family)